jgi:DNA-binding transcriptional MerR regulator
MGRNLTAAQAAERLGISVRTLDRMAGSLDPVTRTDGGHRRYDEDQVERVRQGLPATQEDGQ